MQPTLFLINLDSSPQRLNRCKQRLDAQSLAFERVSAVKGSELDESQRQAHYCESLNRKRYHTALSNGEIGCYLSHRKVWQLIVERNLDYAVVLEDDIELIGDVAQALTALNTIPVSWDIIKLSAYRKRTRKVAYSCVVANQLHLTVHAKPMTGCAAYAITQPAAKKLLQSTSKFGRPVDVDIQHFWEHDIRVLSLLPYVIAQDLNIQSDIQIQRVGIKQKHWLRRKRQQFMGALNNQKAIRMQIKEMRATLQSNS